MPDGDAPRIGWLRPTALVLILALTVTIAILMRPQGPDGLLRFVERPDWVSVTASVGLYAFCTLAGLPRNVVSLSTGAILGLGWGLAVAYGGTLVGAAVAFWLARLLGRDAAALLGGERGAALDAGLVRRGFWAVIGARLAPFIPFTAFNYAAGLTGLRWRTFAWGTVIGVVPGTGLYVAVGAQALAPLGGPLELLAAALALAAAYLGFRLVQRLRRPGG